MSSFAHTRACTHTQLPLNNRIHWCVKYKIYLTEYNSSTVCKLPARWICYYSSEERTLLFYVFGVWGEAGAKVWPKSKRIFIFDIYGMGATRFSLSLSGSVFLTAGQTVPLQHTWKWAYGIIHSNICTHPTPAPLPASSYPEMRVRCYTCHTHSTAIQCPENENWDELFILEVNWNT